MNHDRSPLYIKLQKTQRFIILCSVLLLVIGIFSNIIVISANDGMMPVRMEKAVIHANNIVLINGCKYDFSKSHILMTDKTKKNFLGDIMVMPLSKCPSYFSIGDALIFGGTTSFLLGVLFYMFLQLFFVLNEFRNRRKSATDE